MSKCFVSSGENKSDWIDGDASSWMSSEKVMQLRFSLNDLTVGHRYIVFAQFKNVDYMHEVSFGFTYFSASTIYFTSSPTGFWQVKYSGWETPKGYGISTNSTFNDAGVVRLIITCTTTLSASALGDLVSVQARDVTI